MVPRRCQRGAKDFNAEHAEHAENAENSGDGGTANGNDQGAMPFEPRP
jgi:hypothetical protein